MTVIEQFKQQLEQAKHIVFFGGAGVSTASGIPDFRSADGLYVKDSGYSVPASEIISFTFFKRYPKIFFDYYFKHLVFPDAKPNLAHHYLANLSQSGKRVEIVTQNIDGLHQKAGSPVVYELHGTVYDNYCLRCGKHYSLSNLIKDSEGIPRCVEDKGIVRPNVVLYEENLNQSVVQHAIQAISEADLLIVAGTSLSVYPAAGMIQYFKGEHAVVINKDALNQPLKQAIMIEATLDDVFSKLMQ